MRVAHPSEYQGTTKAKPLRSMPFARRMRARSHGLALLGVIGAFAGSLLLTSTAHAQDRCARIQNELQSLNSSGGGSRAAQIQSAINQQASQLQRAQRAFNQLGCGFNQSGQCASVMGAIDQMQSNIATMQRQLRRAGGGGNQGRIRELERVFATQCGPNQRRQTEQAAQPPRRSLLATLFGVRPQPDQSRQDQSAVVLPERRTQHRGFDRPGRETTREPGIRSVGRTYRTMCVRTSDGFYWPISFSTTRDRFDEDQGLCAAMCPGSGVELFAYRNPGEPIDAMVSTLTGERYTEQDYAFSYRTNFDPNNRCTPSASVLQDLRLSAGVADEDFVPTVPQPMARPAMEQDPESRSLAAGNTSFSELADIARRPASASAQVRVVGPQYRYFTE